MDRTVAVVRGAGSGPELPGGDRAELRALADQLQGVFIQQLFKAMRDTVPESGSAFGRAGQEMFGGIMDEHLAEEAAAQLSRDLGQALYRQLSGSSEGVGGPGTVGGTGEEVL